MTNTVLFQILVLLLKLPDNRLPQLNQRKNLKMKSMYPLQVYTLSFLQRLRQIFPARTYGALGILCVVFRSSGNRDVTGDDKTVDLKRTSAVRGPQISTLYIHSSSPYTYRSPLLDLPHGMPQRTVSGRLYQPTSW